MTDTVEPKRITAGDSVTWTRSLPDYPASSGWALSYVLINAAGKISITASASGADHLVSVSAATSAAWTAGDYDYQACVTKGADRHTVGTGRIVIDPNLAAQTGGFDTRSSARKILDVLLAQYEKAVTGRAYVQEYEVAGRRFKFNAKADWLLEINFWKREVAAERRAARLAAGLGAGTKVYVRF